MGITAYATGVKQRSEKGRTMTRDEIVKLFPTASEEAISALLNMHHSELNAEKAKNKADASDKDTIKSLQEQLEALQNKDLTDSEKLQKQIDELTKANQTANQTIKNMEMKAELLGKGIAAEDADKFIAAMKADKFDASILETMINNAVAAKEKADLKNTPNLGGSAGEEVGNKVVEGIIKGLYSSDNKPQDILSNYIK